MADSPIDDMDDQKLFRNLAQGDEAAFSALYGRYQGRLYRFVLHTSGNSATAEEVAQEVFMRLITHAHGYDPAKGSVAGYLFGMARNLARRGLEHSRMDVSMEESPIGDELLLAGGLNASNGLEALDAFDALEHLSQAELLECLRKAILALPEPYREVVVLCDLEEMSYPGAAALLQCAPGTVASRLHRARALLRTKMKARNWSGRLEGERCTK